MPLSRLAELEPKKVATVTPVEDGWEVILECGHKSFWAVEPPMQTAGCSQCLDELLERLRKRRVVE